MALGYHQSRIQRILFITGGHLQGAIDGNNIVVLRLCTLFLIQDIGKFVIRFANIGLTSGEVVVKHAFTFHKVIAAYLYGLLFFRQSLIRQRSAVVGLAAAAGGQGNVTRGNDFWDCDRLRIVVSQSEDNIHPFHAVVRIGCSASGFLVCPTYLISDFGIQFIGQLNGLLLAGIEFGETLCIHLIIGHVDGRDLQVAVLFYNKLHVGVCILVRPSKAFFCQPHVMGSHIDAGCLSFFALSKDHHTTLEGIAGIALNLRYIEAFYTLRFAVVGLHCGLTGDVNRNLTADRLDDQLTGNCLCNNVVFICIQSPVHYHASEIHTIEGFLIRIGIRSAAGGADTGECNIINRAILIRHRETFNRLLCSSIDLLVTVCRQRHVLVVVDVDDIVIRVFTDGYLVSLLFVGQPGIALERLFDIRSLYRFSKGSSTGGRFERLCTGHALIRYPIVVDGVG